MSLRIMATGEVFSDLPVEAMPFRDLVTLLATGDVVFGDCEGVYADHPQFAPSRKVYHGAKRERAQALAGIGFDVMTVANNHAMDGGAEGLQETIETLRDLGIEAVGVGEDLDQAVKPKVVEHDGTRVAFLGFCSVFPAGYEAREDQPGLAPLRINTLYSDPDPAMWDPGIEPVITTVADETDLERFRAAITYASTIADVVVVACHWGYSREVRERLAPPGHGYDRSWRNELLGYEITYGRLAIEAGADIVVCHHQQALRPVEFWQGKPIFYGLGVLVHHFNRGPDRAPLDEDEGGSAFPYFPFEADSRRTGVAEIDLDGEEVSVGFVPAEILSDGSTRVLPFGDALAGEIADHLEEISDAAGFDTVFTRERVEGGWMRIGIAPGAAASR